MHGPVGGPTAALHLAHGPDHQEAAQAPTHHAGAAVQIVNQVTKRRVVLAHDVDETIARDITIETACVRNSRSIITRVS